MILTQTLVQAIIDNTLDLIVTSLNALNKSILKSVII